MVGTADMLESKMLSSLEVWGKVRRRMRIVNSEIDLSTH